MIACLRQVVVADHLEGRGKGWHPNFLDPCRATLSNNSERVYLRYTEIAIAPASRKILEATLENPPASISAVS